ncbi:MAG TPA: NAD-dependent epimerase/dehydratase family protein, partial [Acidobacteriota bacterium]|nr:NAD-dependent epimerase/dehydratase family protein [Acidobacteriota bacterium]
MSRFWEQQRVIVTGGAGFLGAYVVQKLQQRGVTNIVVPRSASCDLTVADNIKRLYRETSPTVILHLAG